MVDSLGIKESARLSKVCVLGGEQTIWTVVFFILLIIPYQQHITWVLLYRHTLSKSHFRDGLFKEKNSLLGMGRMDVRRTLLYKTFSYYATKI